MTAIREGEDVYHGCEPKQLEAVWLIVATFLVAIIYGIVFFMVTHISPSILMDESVQAEVVTSRTEAATSNFDFNEVRK